MCKRKGFTLIELLMVIAIIALLMAVLMPALNKAKQLARTMVCRSNLKQYGIALSMYLNDNEGYFPNPEWWLCKKEPGQTHPTYGPFSVPDGWKPGGQMWRYLKMADFHLCPTSRVVCRRIGWPAEQGKWSYCQNGVLGARDADGNPSEMPGWVSKASEVKRPATTCSYTEENPPSADGTSLVPELYFHTINWAFYPHDSMGAGDGLATYHKPPRGDITKGKANAVFLDNHVEEVDEWDKDKKARPDIPDSERKHGYGICRRPLT